MKRIVAATVLVLGLAMGGPAQAVTIDFDAITTTNVDFSGTHFEDGFTLAFTDMFINTGNAASPPNEVERIAGGSTTGVLTITKTGGGTFEFSAVDWQLEYGTTASISLEGYLGGPSAGVDTFSTGSFAYNTFGAANLSGVTIDTLVIRADRNLSAGGSFDNVELLVAAVVPAPAPVVLLAIGVSAMYAAARARRHSGAAARDTT